MLIERTIDYSNLKKRRLSIGYVKSRLSRVCSSLISGMSPAVDWLDWGYFHWTWETTIMHEYSSKEWAWYYQYVSKSREEALTQIRYIADYQRDLLEDELLGKVMVLLNCLENKSWDWWVRMTETDDIWKLKNIADLAASASSRAFNIFKEHNDLLGYEQRSSLLMGESSLEKKIDKRELKNDLKSLEELLNRSMNFKNAVEEKAMPYLAARKKKEEHKN